MTTHPPLRPRLSRLPRLPRLSRGRSAGILAVGLVLLILAGVGIYGLAAGSRRGDSHSSEVSPAVTSPDHTIVDPPTAPRVARSTDPDVFAQSVAMALFTWDTGSGLMPLDYTAAILQVGERSGAEQAGLACDIATYLPTRETWLELRTYATIQSLTISQAFVPTAWAEAVRQAHPGQLPQGATAVTIEGTRHRTGVWNGETVASAHEVAFTVFVDCPPATPESAAGACSLLRLSQLDNPLR